MATTTTPSEPTKRRHREFSEQIEHVPATDAEILTRARVACAEAAQLGSLSVKQRRAFASASDLAAMIQPLPHLRVASAPPRAEREDR